MQYKVIDVDSPQYKEDEKRLQSLRTMVILWLIVLALGVLLIPLMLIAGWARNDMMRLASDLVAVQSAISDATSPHPETIELGAEVERVNQLISAVQTTTVPTSANWPVVVDAVAQYSDLSITIASLTQTENEIQIMGRALSSDAVVRYQQRLVDARAFEEVTVISMTAVSSATPQAEDAEATDPPVQAAPEVPVGTVDFIIDLRVETSQP